MASCMLSLPLLGHSTDLFQIARPYSARGGQIQVGGGGYTYSQ